MTRFAYAGDEGELSFKKGIKIKILERDDPSFWFGEIDDGSGQRGGFPASYVTIMKKSNKKKSGSKVSSHVAEHSLETRGGEWQFNPIYVIIAIFVRMHACVQFKY